MVSYKDLGLVNTKKMFAKAIKGGYAIPAYNFNNMEQLQAIIQACVENELAGYFAGFFRCTQIRKPNAVALHGTGSRCVCKRIGLQKTPDCAALGPRLLDRKSVV